MFKQHNTIIHKTIMDQVKLSIIVPVYNVERYVERCLRSVLSQGITATDYEVIIQNDGSTDGSLAAVERIVQDHQNCLVLSSENRGLSAARNAALSHAQGQYVWFVDSDDWIENNAIKDLWPYLDGHNDLVQFGYKSISSDGKYKEYSRLKRGNISGCEAFLIGFPMGAQYSVYKREFLLKDELFFEGIYHEDNEFTPRTILRAKQVTILNKSLYYHFIENVNSITFTPSIKRCYDLVFVSKRHLKSINSQHNKNINAALLNLAALEFNTSLRIAYKTKDNEEFNKFIGSIQKSYIRNFLKCSKFKYRIMAIGCWISIKWYTKLINHL